MFGSRGFILRLLSIIILVPSLNPINAKMWKENDSLSGAYKKTLATHRKTIAFSRVHCIKIIVLWHTKSRNRKGYENHVITLYSVVTWFFFCKFCLIFREFKANLTVTWLKCVVFSGYPSLTRKMGKWEKQACFSKELALYKMQFVYYNLSSEKVGTRIIILNVAIIKKIHK